MREVPGWVGSAGVNMAGHPDFSTIAEILPLDCPTILNDLEAKGVSNSEVARILNLPRSTVRGWKMGRMPVEPNGRRLTALFALYYPDAKIPVFVPSCVPQETTPSI